MAVNGLIHIFNLALDYIGEEALTDAAQASPLAERVRRAWPMVRDEVLRSHVWKCACARTALIRTGSVPTFGFAYSYALPPDFLRLVSTCPEGARCRVEGPHLLADEPQMSIAYVRRLEDPASYDPALVQCMALKLAATWPLRPAPQQPLCRALKSATRLSCVTPGIWTPWTRRIPHSGAVRSGRRPKWVRNRRHRN